MVSPEVDVAMLLESLQRALGTLAAPFSDQASYLSTIGVGESADELALEFDDAYRPVAPRLLLVGAPEELQASLRAVDDALYSDLREWSTQALASSPEWVAIRQLAAGALAALVVMRKSVPRNLDSDAP